MFASAVPFGTTLYFPLAPPGGMSDGALLAWLACRTIGARSTFTFLVIPWTAIAAEFSEDRVEQKSIITYCSLVGWIGGLAFPIFTRTYLFPSMEDYLAGQLNPEYYPAFGLILRALCILWTLLATYGALEVFRFRILPSLPHVASCF